MDAAMTEANKRKYDEATTRHAQENGLDDAQTRMLRAFGGMMAENTTNMEAKIDKVDKKVDTPQTGHDALVERVKKLEDKPSGAASSDGGSGGTRPFPPSLGSFMAANGAPGFKPPKQRNVGCVGGFVYTDGATIVDVVKTALDSKGVAYQRLHAVGTFSDRVKIVFKDSDDMWKWRVMK